MHEAFMISISELYNLYLKHPQISTDTRQITPGSIFFALKGDNFNGNKFAAQALEKGAAYAVIEDAAFRANERCLLTDNVLATLQNLARHHRQQLSIPVVGITGSNGKTTTKELIHAVLSGKYKTHATKGNLNNHIGVPLTLLSVQPEHEMAVIEMGANHQKEIEELCGIALPDYGLITNVGKAHLEGFGGEEGVRKGKGELYAYLAAHGGKVFLNGNNKVLEEMADHAGLAQRIVYGTSGDLYCRGRLLSSHPFLAVEWTCGKNHGEIHSRLIGAYNFENILSAICIGNYFEVDASQIKHAIENYIPDNSRSQVVIKGSNKIILDAYNANPTSMAAALRNFAELSDAKKIVFLGEMAELGSESKKEHQALADLLSSMQLDELVLVGKNFSEINLSKKYLRLENSEEAAAYAREKKFSDASILIKGSRSAKMEKVLEAL